MFYVSGKNLKQVADRKISQLVEGDILKRKNDNFYYKIDSIFLEKNEKSGSKNDEYNFFGFVVSGKAMKKLFYTNTFEKEFFVYEEIKDNLLLLA